MTTGLYLRKAWVPPTCAHCGKTARAVLSGRRAWSGSLLWMQELRFACLLAEYMGDFVKQEYEAIREQASWYDKFVGKWKDKWQGGIIRVPFGRAAAIETYPQKVGAYVGDIIVQKTVYQTIPGKEPSIAALAMRQLLYGDAWIKTTYDAINKKLEQELLDPRKDDR